MDIMLFFYVLSKISFMFVGMGFCSPSIFLVAHKTKRTRLAATLYPLCIFLWSDASHYMLDKYPGHKGVVLLIGVLVSVILIIWAGYLAVPSTKERAPSFDFYEMAVNFWRKRASTENSEGGK